MDNPKRNESADFSSDLIDRLYKTPVERLVLDNGLTLVHRPDFSSEVVSVQVWVKTGSIHEGPLVGSGLSHYLEHLLFKGTTRREGKSISREVHAMGGGINAYTTFDRTVYYIDAPSSAFETAVDILADIVLHSTLPEEEVQREQAVILREIDMGLDDPDRQLSQALFRTAFLKHPYREPVIGHRSLFEKVTREELYEYYKARYVPNNIVVTIVGAITPERCQEAVSAHFGKVPRGRLAPVQIDSEPSQLAPRRENIFGDYNIFRGGLAYKVPHLSHKDSPSLDALAHALGGGESSLLWERLRNQEHLVHYIDCRNWNPGANGLFWISYVCDPGNEVAVNRAIHDVIESVCQNGLDERVVKKACRQALSSEINGRKTMSGQASRLGLGELVIGDIHYGQKYLKRLQLVRVSDLQAVAKRYLVEEGMSALTMGPRAAAPSSERKRQKNDGTPKPFEVVAFEGGAHLLYQQDSRLPKVHLRCVMQGGPIYEPTDQRGISSLLVELLTKDTEKRSGAELSSLIEGLGGSFSATGGNNTISFAIEVLPEDIDLAIELLGDALTCPRFDPDTFQTELDAQIAGLKEEDDEILDYGFRKLRARYYGQHPFAVSSDGRVEDLEKLTVEAVKAHYERLVCAGNITVSICGDFDVTHVSDQLKPLFEKRLNQKSFEPINAQPYAGPASACSLVETMDREQAVVLQAFPDVGVRDEEYVVGEVLNELFSGMSSRLFERIREDKGMAYYVGSSRVVGLSSSMFVFYAGTHPQQADEVALEIDREVARVKAGQVSEEELARCRTRLKAARPMGRQTIGARAMHAAINHTYGLPLDDDAEHARKLDQVDAGSLAAFTNRYFDPARSVRLVVKPSEADLQERPTSAL